MVRSVLASLALVVLASCPNRPPAAADAPPGSILIHADQLRIHGGQVGMIDPRPGTYVLVDVENKNLEEYIVAVNGIIKNAAGEEVKLGFDEMPVPAGARRTFALVAEHDVVGPNAATPRVARAKRNPFPPPISVAKEQTTAQGETLVVTAEVKSHQKRDGVANVIAAFHDAEGRPLARPFTRIVLGPGAVVPVTFRGPPGAKTATIFVGESVF